MTEMYPEKILTNKNPAKQHPPYRRHQRQCAKPSQQQFGQNRGRSRFPRRRLLHRQYPHRPKLAKNPCAVSVPSSISGIKDKQTDGISFSFVSLNLKDLPPSQLRDKVLNIPTSFYLPPEDVDNLRTAAAELMKQSLDYRNLLAEFAAHPNPDAIFAAPPPDAQEFKPLNEKKKQ